jgi:aspartate racemase
MGEHNHPEITLQSIPMARHMPFILADDWQGVADLMAESAKKAAAAGAEFAICPDNTYHQAFPWLIQKSPIPFLHIAEVVAEEATKRGFKHLGIMGTKYLTEGPVYPSVLEKVGLNYTIPDEADRERINTIIFKELVNGIFHISSRAFFNEVMEKLKAAGCDAAVLGCTEIPLIVRPDEAPLPTLDSTRLLARAAVAEAIR